MSIKIHHLNCGTMCPMCQLMVNGHGSLIKSAELVCHCLLIETPETLVMVDTGIGMRDVLDPRGLSANFRLFNRPRFLIEETAIAQVKALGYNAGDVGHIIATHLDLDHAGGLPDFPAAKVHIFKPELNSALTPTSKLQQHRYRSHHFVHQPKWVLHEEQGDSWFGFNAIRILPQLNAEILLVPLVGHTEGHSGVAIRNGNRWLFHAGDAYFHHGTLNNPPHVPPALQFFEYMLQMQGEQRVKNQIRLRELATEHSNEVDVFCSHDPVDWRRLSTAKLSNVDNYLW